MFSDVLSWLCKALFVVGLLATLVGLGVLVFTIFATAGTQVPTAEKTQALNNVAILANVLYAGIAGLGVGSAYLFASDQPIGVGQLILGLGLFFTQVWMPYLVATPSEAGQKAEAAMQTAGAILSAIGLVVFIIDVYNKTQERIKQGAKADQLKYGKGTKEQADKQNVLMGKCWQLPFCRKFVRDRCPIYHARRTCWRELVGCMCEESVIRNAMENKTVPKDALLAGSMIPRNTKLTDKQKKDRCKTCVIYNEHLKHKYRVAVPGVVLSWVALFVLLNYPLKLIVEKLLNSMGSAANTATFTKSGQSLTDSTGPAFTQMILVVIFILAISYTMKVLEHVIFNLKL